MKNIFLAICTAFLLCSCTTALTRTGATVQIIDDKSKYECRFIGVVNTFDTLGATTGHESENAMNAARNKAAKLGANAIKIIHMQTTFQGTTVSAEALDCNFGRENLQSSPKAAVYPARSPGADEQAVQNPTVGQQLIDLQKAKDAGAITDSEYQTQKAKLLGNK